MEQEGNFKSMLFSIVILDHIDRLHILDIFLITEETKDQFILLLLHFCLDSLDLISFMKTVGILDDALRLVVSEIDLLLEIRFDSFDPFVGIEL